MTRDNDSSAWSEARFTGPIVTGLPAVASIKAEDMLRLFWATITLGRERVTEALAEAHVRDTLGQTSAEFAGLCGALKMLKGRKYPDLVVELLMTQWDSATVCVWLQLVWFG